MKLTALAACASTALAFADTAAFFSSVQLESGSSYITKSADLASAFERLTAKFCSESPDEKLTIFRVGQLSRSAPVDVGPETTFLKHVHYLAGSEIDLPVAKECTVVYVDESIADLDSLNANVIVVDVENSQKHTVEEFMTGGHVMVQGKPGFHTAGSRGESIREFLGDKLNFGFDTLTKRGSDDSAFPVYSDATLEEVENDFEIAESLLAAQESDAAVTALSDESRIKDYSGSARNSTTSRSNLFTKYQFFTPGVWLVLIVCFFLVYVSITAVGWITSIDLSYRSFEKQVEYEKKTE
ncbi:hypothetical protein METSCH_A14550 [Metschnikowia aff. pulcherrima]|uniref:Protein BIG1 n=1 Tax=Metschnikowia aff. pulcherrima TaxID=2163413 RepID=A0A4P6XLG7_9ASCO|nr:hypothetical protein METSCH_A14550 [Metschnikowia aff. pulcherrima]